MDKEKQVRIRIDGKVDQMIRESAELKEWTITEVIHWKQSASVLHAAARSAESHAILCLRW